MKDQTPRKGDLAVRIRSAHGHSTGWIVKVESDPEPGHEYCYCGCGREYRGQMTWFKVDGRKWKTMTAWLVRIPPPDEAARLFAEEPIKAREPA